MYYNKQCKYSILLLTNSKQYLQFLLYTICSLVTYPLCFLWFDQDNLNMERCHRSQLCTYCGILTYFWNFWKIFKSHDYICKSLIPRRFWFSKQRYSTNNNFCTKVTILCLYALYHASKVHTTYRLVYLWFMIAYSSFLSKNSQ